MTEQNNNQNQGQGNNDQQNNQNQGNQQDQNKQGQGDGQGKGEGQGQEAKFTQEDLNNFAAKIRSEEKAKYDKLKADADRKAELDKMEENDRLKAEKEDVEKQLQEMQAKIKYNEERTAAATKLSEAKLDSRLIDVLMSDKSNEDKIKLMADIQKEVIDKAIKDAMPSHKPAGSGGDKKSILDSDQKVKYGFEKFK